RVERERLSASASSFNLRFSAGGTRTARTSSAGFLATMGIVYSSRIRLSRTIFRNYSREGSRPSSPVGGYWAGGEAVLMRELRYLAAGAGPALGAKNCFTDGRKLLISATSCASSVTDTPLASAAWPAVSTAEAKTPHVSSRWASKLPDPGRNRLLSASAVGATFWSSAVTAGASPATFWTPCLIALPILSNQVPAFAKKLGCVAAGVTGLVAIDSPFYLYPMNRPLADAPYPRTNLSTASQTFSGVSSCFTS